MKTMIPVGYQAGFNRLALCVLDDLSRYFDSTDPNYESLLAAFDHRLDPKRLSVEDSLQVIQSIQPLIQTRLTITDRLFTFYKKNRLDQKFELSREELNRSFAD